MSADKRTVSTDALETLGTLIGPNEKRDAIHLAVIPVEAGTELQPSQHITISGDKAYPAGMGKGMAIVDPFLLMTHVNAGQRFWAVIYPRVITSLRHVWTHPQLADEAGVPKQSDAEASSEAWLRNWCENSEISYEDLILVSKTGEVKSAGRDAEDYGGKRWELYGDSLISLGSDACGQIPSEVWDHVRVVIGTEPAGRPEYFSCSC